MNNKKKKIRILFVEDVPSDYELAQLHIRKEGIEFESIRVETEKDFLRALKEFKPDVVISDYSMPQFDGGKALKLCQKFDPNLPLIILTGSINEETAVECLKAGAIDYVIKEHTTRLPYAILEALEQRKTRLEKEAAIVRLKEERAKLASILRSAPVGIGVVLNRIFLDVNNTFCEMLRYTRDELMGQNARMIYPSDEEYEYVGKEKYRQIKKQGFGIVETIMRCKDGDTVHVILSSSIIDQNDPEKGFTFTALDITERKKMELALKESELHFRTLANSGKALVWTSGVDKKCNFFNNPWLCFTGRKLEQELGDGWIEGVHPDDMKNCLDTYVSSFEKREPFSMIYRLRRHDGVYRWLQDDGSPRYDLDGNFIGYIGHCLDITDRIETQNALSRRLAIDSALAGLSKELLNPESSLDSISPLIIKHSLELTESLYGLIGNIDPVSGEYIIRWFGERHGDDIPNPLIFNRMINKDDNGNYVGLWGNALNTGKSFFTNKPKEHLAYREVPEWHNEIYNYLSVPVIVDKEIVGQITLANSSRGFTEDDLITMERIADYYGLFLKDLKMSKALRTSEERLVQSQKMEAIGRLAGGVAHDYNNMLQTILGYVEIIQQKHAKKAELPEEKLIKYLNEIQKAANQSADLTRQLLAFARKQTIKPENTNVNDAINDILNMLQRLIGEDISLIWKPSYKNNCILIDPTQLNQILVNLVVNARDAIAKEGIISIETDSVILDEMFCRMYDNCSAGEYVKLSISDNGYGISKSDLKQIYEPFFTTKEKAKGTGLGLATVYGIVKQNNGIIDANSKENVGTVFSIFFPLLNEELSNTSDLSIENYEYTGSGTILVVEDEEMLLEFIVTVLEQHGFKVISSTLPNRAIKLIKQEKESIALLLTDVIMPEMNGKELWQNLLNFYPQIKCIFMSGYSADVITHKGVLEDGINFLQKPFTANTLIKKISELMSNE